MVDESRQVREGGQEVQEEKAGKGVWEFGRDGRPRMSEGKEGKRG